MHDPLVAHVGGRRAYLHLLDGEPGLVQPGGQVADGLLGRHGNSSASTTWRRLMLPARRAAGLPGLVLGPTGYQSSSMYASVPTIVGMNGAASATVASPDAVSASAKAV
ncbi:hypothetical protein GCM10023205_35380 [Yinghuangia aomiensis]|uniref:Uncharacterized protein n=1 Tax=Yinghuangia aomiensis TaxID=676205 RepID=A0ABP9HCK1_9ACTN